MHPPRYVRYSVPLNRVRLGNAFYLFRSVEEAWRERLKRRFPKKCWSVGAPSVVRSPQVIRNIAWAILKKKKKKKPGSSEEGVTGRGWGGGGTRR